MHLCNKGEDNIMALHLHLHFYIIT